MIFDLSANMGEPYKLPVLDGSYPADASVTVGTAVSCKVVISTAGNPETYTYQWYKDGSKVSGATSSTYSTTDIKGSHTVYCEVTNSAGTVKSRTATITVSTRYLIKSGVPQVTFSKTSNSVLSKQDGEYWFYGLAGGYFCMWASSINLTGCTKLRISGDFDCDWTDYNLCVWGNSTSPTYTNYTAASALKNTSPAISVSNLTGKYRVGITSVYTDVQKIKNLWLE